MASNRHHTNLQVSTLVLVVFSAIVAAHPHRYQRPAPEKLIPLPANWKPEGIATGWGNNVYVASLLGKVAKVNVLTKEVTEVFNVAPPAFAVARMFVGLKVSLETNLMFVAGGFTGKAYIATLNPRTGLLARNTIIQTVNLTLPVPEGGSPVFINDVALRTTYSRRGRPSVTAYFTNSQSPFIYEVSGCPRNCALTATYTSPFYVSPPALGPNGILADPLPPGMLITANGNSLIKSVISNGTLLEVSNVTITEQNGTVSRVRGDGLLMTSSRTLYVSEQQLNFVTKLRFTGRRDYNAAVVVGRDRDPLFVNQATIAVGAGELYVTNTHFADANLTTRCPGAQPSCPITPFAIVRVDGFKSR